MDGKWVTVGEVDNNQTRLIKIKFDSVKATAVRIRVNETYGAKNVKLYEVRCYA